MHFLAPLVAVFCTIGFSMAATLPVATSGELNGRDIKARYDHYALTCNDGNFNVEDIRICKDKIRSLPAGTMCKVGGPDGHFCQSNGLFISGVTWGHGTITEIFCWEVVTLIEAIENTCQQRGGSIGARQDWDNDLVVHMTNHNV
ncbi:hypothetical protein BT63DRAFT_482249 [Microthyrium microscopicum]|uniref:Cyanovirin-N domain-containing protein n=1 Tax=Microthyrium microscopicum TaxID=703497 RepID=A0A6A6TYZ7_9PEZI|nr:hypothetical protein BT63DRAFT_482249 [Microthyrium microscopicum]